MTIGIDLSPLQGPHRRRGIGYTLINFVNNISPGDRENNTFVFYLYLERSDEALGLLDLTNLNYEVRTLKRRRRMSRKLPGRLNILASIANQLIELRDLCFGDSRISSTQGISVYVQIDQSQHLPRRGNKLTKVLMLHDLIPYVIRSDYLLSYHIAREKGITRKGALRAQARRSLYAIKIRVNAKRANKLLANSQATKDDFVKYMKVPSRKITVTPLGVSIPEKRGSANPQLYWYAQNSWGYVKQPLKLNTTDRFLLYVGGADPRRKLEDLVTAFNHLRAQGYELKLLLVGDTMQGLKRLDTPETKKAIEISSYSSDIIFMGFVEDSTRDWLYENAVAFIFPSRYEGFGLPVLEAMIQGCPVISYENKATREVAGSTPAYTNNAGGLQAEIKNLLSANEKDLSDIRKHGIIQAQKYDWEVTSRNILKALS